MPTNRTAYNVQGLFLAPYSGEQNATTDFFLQNSLILKRIEKLQSFDYDAVEERMNLNSFGHKQSLFRGSPNNLRVNLSFAYIPDGFTNENRLNFDVSHFSGNSPFMFSGLCTNSFLLNKRDFYLITNKNENDIESDQALLSSGIFKPNSIGDVISPKSPSYNVLHFQNCYLQNYSFICSIGSLPQIVQNYECDNFTYYTSGSGIDYRSFDSRSGESIPNGFRIIIPKDLDYYQTGTPIDINRRSYSLSGRNILLPADASVKINTNTQTGVNFYLDTIQGFNLSLRFKRKEQRRINNIFPIFKRLSFPIEGKFSVSLLAAQDLSGSLFNTLNRDEDYDILINFPAKTPEAENSFIGLTGCKFVDISYDSSIGSDKRVDLNFEFELDPDFGKKGLFASGNVLHCAVRRHPLPEHLNTPFIESKKVLIY